jgi:hypothetical protein
MAKKEFDVFKRVGSSGGIPDLTFTQEINPDSTFTKDGILGIKLSRDKKELRIRMLDDEDLKDVDANLIPKPNKKPVKAYGLSKAVANTGKNAIILDEQKDIKVESNLTQGNTVKLGFIESKRAEREVKTNLANESENHINTGKLEDFTEAELKTIWEAWELLASKGKAPDTTFIVINRNNFTVSQREIILDGLLKVLSEKGNPLGSLDKDIDILLTRFGWLK